MVIPRKRVILTLGSSPVDQTRLRLDKELREIKTVLRLAKYGDRFSLEQQWAVRPDDLQDALLNIEPEIVHFCGHGTGLSGLALENEMGKVQLVSTDALVRLFKLIRHVRCVVLNACYSEVQAEAISEHIDYVIGMNQAIGDEAAINFSKAFYRALANNKTFEEAYEFGCNAIDLQSLPDYLIPVLKIKKQTNDEINQQRQKPSIFFTLYPLFKNSILFLTEAVIYFCRTALSQWVQMPIRSDIPNESTIPATLSNQNKHIEEAKSEPTKIREENQELSETWNSSFLYPALLKLGYGKQAILFKTLIKKLSVGSFLIYGEPEYGQRWLLNRLIKQQISKSTTNKVIRIVLTRITKKNDVSAIWRELAGRVNLERQSSPEQIIERIYKWCQTQNVILIVDCGDCLPEMYINELIDNFWMPLANQTRDANASTSKFKLLLFLVDYGGCIENWNVQFVEQLDPSWNPDITIKLPILTKFSDVELMNWLESECEALPPDLREELDNDTVQSILENTDYGIPEPTLEEICRLCGCNWHEEERKWLTF